MRFGVSAPCSLQCLDAIYLLTGKTPGLLVSLI